MRVLVIGGGGFIGSVVVAALAGAGHQVVRATRRPTAMAATPGVRDIGCDLARDLAAETWLPRLAGIDAVVNCAGILRERGESTFERVHVEAPRALFAACARAGVRRVVQISAIGDARDGPFVATKHRGDEALRGHDLDWVVLRPSLVWTPRGSYGGTSLLRAMAALPWVIPVPGDGGQPVAPVTAEDVAAVVLACVADTGPRRATLDVVGPRAMGIRDFLLAVRGWLRTGPARVVPVPRALVAVGCQLGEVLGTGPLGNTMRRMLERGNVGEPGAHARLIAQTGVRTRDVDDVLAAAPSFVQDRWHARLYLVAPLLRLSLAALWLLSGVVGLVHPIDDSARLLAPAGVSGVAVPVLVWGASALDLVLGVALVAGRAVPAVGMLMLASVLAYTAFIGIALPSSWLEPFGGLAKNLVLAPAILAMLATHDRR
ncbi:MAG: SDR family oxidoreductase [Ectothiorhodospiraceae bacterium]|nr:SDR family oxidoreductase [Ectothiorhodospiraceae bacterium]